MIMCNGKECSNDCPVSNTCSTMEMRKNGISDEDILSFLDESFSSENCNE